MPSLPAPFFYESEARKKHFSQERHEKDASPPASSATLSRRGLRRAGRRGRTAFHPHHAQKLIRPPEGAP